EVERDQLGGEAVGLGLGDDERPRTVSVRIEVPAKTGDECLERAHRVLWASVPPDQLAEAVGGDAMTARREQDLEHLLRPRSTQVGRAERARVVFDRELPE